MTPVAAPADKRFRRARVSPARKRRWRPSWRTLGQVVVICVLFGFLLYHAVTLVLRSEALTVARIRVQGNERMSKGEVVALLDGLTGANMLTIDLESWRQKLLTSPWVANAAVRRIFPGTMAVAIVERKPIGIGRLKGALYLIDRTGAVIDEFGPNYADLDLPLVDGLSTDGDSAAVDEARAGLAARLMNELQRWPSLAAQVSQIDVSDVRNAVVMLKGDTALVRIGAERFSERLQSYLDLAPALREQVPNIDYVDLRFDERVYVRPLSQRSGARRVPLAAGSGARASVAGGG